MAMRREYGETSSEFAARKRIEGEPDIPIHVPNIYLGYSEPIGYRDPSNLHLHEVSSCSCRYCHEKRAKIGTKRIPMIE